MRLTYSPARTVSSTPRSACTGWSPTTNVRSMPRSSIIGPAPSSSLRSLRHRVLPRLDALAIERQHDEVAGAQAVADLGEVPVAKTDGHRPLAQRAALAGARGAVEQQDPLLLDERRRRDAQHVRLDGEDHLDVGRRAGQQVRRDVRIGELDLDLDRAVLLLDVEDVRRHAG